MSVDHSETYKRRSLKNLPHRVRLRSILMELDKRVTKDMKSFADFGCSNGYLTDIIARRYSIRDAHGYDYEETHVAAAREHHPQVAFQSVDLNQAGAIASDKYDLVTCFETLEHVGDLDTALKNLISATATGGLLFITVPIETGFWGLTKFLVKNTLYAGRYNSQLRELSADAIGMRYAATLLVGGDVSKYRDKRSRWGTHYGFDCRAIERVFAGEGVAFSSVRHFTTRFYFVRM